MIRLSDIIAGYGKRKIVEGVDLEIKKGEIVTLIGPNGGGKSTLLKSINGSLKLLKGSVFIGDDDISKLPLKEVAKRMSIVTTDRVKPQLMTALEVVLSGRLPYTDGFGTFRDDDKEAAKRAMEMMNISELCDRPYMNLSDGQKQRALIARAICQDPEYLIMDEPTSYMDIKHRLELMEVVKSLSKSGVTVVMSLHELELALAVSDELILVYSDGHVQCASRDKVMKEELLKELFDLDDRMYEKAVSGIREPGRGSSFFVNTACEYFPCHDVPRDKFNCMFCYCPLYDMKDCGGDYTYTDKGVKNCKNCGFVHDRDNYPKVIKKLKEKMYAADTDGKI